jgi:hypothetical protein
MISILAASCSVLNLQFLMTQNFRVRHVQIWKYEPTTAYLSLAYVYMYSIRNLLMAIFYIHLECQDVCKMQGRNPSILAGTNSLKLEDGFTYFCFCDASRRRGLGLAILFYACLDILLFQLLRIARTSNGWQLQLSTFCAFVHKCGLPWSGSAEVETRIWFFLLFSCNLDHMDTNISILCFSCDLTCTLLCKYK